MNSSFELNLPGHLNFYLLSNHYSNTCFLLNPPCSLKPSLILSFSLISFAHSSSSRSFAPHASNQARHKHTRMHKRACLNQCCGVQAACEHTKPGPRRPRLARPHACTQQQHSHSTRHASRAKAGIRSRASRARQHAALRHPHSAKPLPPSRRIVPSPRRAARRAKAVPAAMTAAVRHSASASPPTRKAARAREGACPTRPFTACRLIATPLKASRRVLAQHPPPPPIKAAQATRHRHAEFAVPPAPSPFFFLASISPPLFFEQEQSHERRRRSPQLSHLSSIPSTVSTPVTSSTSPSSHL